MYPLWEADPSLQRHLNPARYKPQTHGQRRKQLWQEAISNPPRRNVSSVKGREISLRGSDSGKCPGFNCCPCADDPQISISGTTSSLNFNLKSTDSSTSPRGCQLQVWRSQTSYDSTKLQLFPLEPSLPTAQSAPLVKGTAFLPVAQDKCLGVIPDPCLLTHCT